MPENSYVIQNVKLVWKTYYQFRIKFFDMFSEFSALSI